MRVAVLGGSGFVGRHLCAALQQRGDEARAISLRDPEAAAQAARDCDAIVNLAGEPIGQHWNDDVKRAILTSRTELPRRFLAALTADSFAARSYVSASAIGYYGTSLDATFVESSAPGDDFLASVCVAWEREADAARALGMRVACMRQALVLGKDGGALQRMLPPFRMGAGGIIGTGKQWYSWVHVDDLVGIYLVALDGADGALNASSPNPVTNAEFTKSLGEALHRPTLFPVPTIALRAMLGEGADALLSGQRVLPEHTLALGYTFKHPALREAFTDLLL